MKSLNDLITNYSEHYAQLHAKWEIWSFIVILAIVALILIIQRFNNKDDDA